MLKSIRYRTQDLHQITAPLVIQKWHLQALCWCTDGAIVGRPQKSCSTTQRGLRSGLKESEMVELHPPGHVKQAHFLTPSSITNHSSPTGITVLPGWRGTSLIKKSDFNHPSQRNVVVNKLRISSPYNAQKRIDVAAPPDGTG